MTIKPFKIEIPQAALDDLYGRGWLSMADGNYALTEAGQAVRDDVEQKTDAYFYAPWDVIDDTIFNEFTDILQRLHDSCQSLINK